MGTNQTFWIELNQLIAQVRYNIQKYGFNDYNDKLHKNRQDKSLRQNERVHRSRQANNLKQN